MVNVIPRRSPWIRATVGSCFLNVKFIFATVPGLVMDDWRSGRYNGNDAINDERLRAGFQHSVVIDFAITIYRRSGISGNSCSVRTTSHPKESWTREKHMPPVKPDKGPSALLKQYLIGGTSRKTQWRASETALAIKPIRRSRKIILDI